jgi:AcrR family transcriptional regulator
MTSAASETRTIPASQLARRERILDAAVALATDGGWDAVQMRAVADSADVALGTLYRYFPSKVHLLVSAMGRTFQTLSENVRAAGVEGSPDERVYRVVAAVTRYISRHRRLSGAMLRAMMTADVDAAADVEAVGDMLVGLIAEATHEPGAAPSDRDILTAHIIGKVWLTDVMTHLSGRMTVSAMLDDLQSTISLLMTPTR